jgi:pyridoxal phosphate enzyme (YggS family)
MAIPENILRLKQEIPEGVAIIAVSKTRPDAEILEAWRAGQHSFGENKAQELKNKHQLLPDEIDWHFIGHLQTNKVKTIAPFINVVHSVDSIRLLAEINREAERYNRIIDCLLQFHIATEETKFGLNFAEALEMLTSPVFARLNNIRIRGVMGMASFSEDQSLVATEFRALHDNFARLKQEFFSQDKTFSEISMGMSGDYQIAIEEGSTMIRIGTAIFGERSYT